MLKIALVDDSVILRSAIKNVLDSSGFKVVLKREDPPNCFQKLKTAVWN